MDITDISSLNRGLIGILEPDRRLMVPADAAGKSGSKIRAPGLYRKWMINYLRAPVLVGAMAPIEGRLTPPDAGSIYPPRSTAAPNNLAKSWNTGSSLFLMKSKRQLIRD
jgi:hypothetical protein